MEQNNSPYYLKIGDENTSLEFDLVTFRQKGQEEKYLSINFSGVDISKDPPVTQEAFVNIDEDGFKAIKIFFQQLEWNK